MLRIICSCIFSISCWLFSINTLATCTITIDLLHPKNKQVCVTVIPPKTIKSNHISYVLPINTQGNLPDLPWIESVKAYDKTGETLPISYGNNNTITIHKAKQLAKLVYWLSGTNKHRLNIQMYEPCLIKDTYFTFSFNNVLGYFSTIPPYPITVHLLKPEHLTAATSLDIKTKNDTLDIVQVTEYHQLLQSPILYATWDTLQFTVKNTLFHVKFTALEANKNITKNTLYYSLHKILPTLLDFVRLDTLKKYNFIFSFMSQANHDNQSIINYGGLHFDEASFYILPALKKAAALKKVIRQVASHEFLHLLTPHQLHSEKLPKVATNQQLVSKHLWLYEGVTEYLSGLALLRAGVISEGDFFQLMANKIKVAQQFPVMSLTKTSERIFQPKYQKHYHNFYYKGAIIAFCLDILLQQQLQQSLLEIVWQLIDKYKTQPYFEDELLLENLHKLTNDTIANFLTKYIEGKNEMPYEQFLDRIGVSYFETLVEPVGSYGSFQLIPNYKMNRMQFYKVKGNNLGIRSNDILISVNEQNSKVGNFATTKKLLYHPLPNQPINLVVLRDGKKVSLSAKAGLFKKTTRHIIKKQHPAIMTTQKQKLRNQVLQKNTVIE